jgi:hypothetical protein
MSDSFRGFRALTVLISVGELKNLMELCKVESLGPRCYVKKQAATISSFMMWKEPETRQTAIDAVISRHVEDTTTATSPE